jgi:hypothetical protein
MIVLKFVKIWRMYQTGETAGFDEAMAAQIVGSGFAVIHDPEAEAAAEAAAKAAEEAAAAEAAAKAKEGGQRSK